MCAVKVRALAARATSGLQNARFCHALKVSRAPCARGKCNVVVGGRAGGGGGSVCGGVRGKGGRGQRWQVWAVGNAVPSVRPRTRPRAPHVETAARKVLAVMARVLPLKALPGSATPTRQGVSERKCARIARALAAQEGEIERW